MAISDEELEAIERRANAASPGPWHECGASGGRCSCGTVWSKPVDAPVATCNKEWGDDPEMVYGSIPDGHRENNAAFIAAARTDVPRLCTELRALRQPAEPDAQGVALRAAVLDIAREAVNGRWNSTTRYRMFDAIDAYEAWEAEHGGER